jgi:hypothetical protein
MSPGCCKIGAVDEEETFLVAGGTVYVGRANAEGPGPIG